MYHSAVICHLVLSTFEQIVDKSPGKNQLQLTRDNVYRLTFNEVVLASDKTLSTKHQKPCAWVSSGTQPRIDEQRKSLSIM